MLSALDPRFLRSDTAARKRARRILLSAAIVGSAGYFTGVIAATLYEDPLFTVASAVPFLGMLLCCISLFILLTPDPSGNGGPIPLDQGRDGNAAADKEKASLSFARQEPPACVAPCVSAPVEPKPATEASEADEPSASPPDEPKEKPRLTKRERDLLIYLAGPDSYHSIASRFDVSTSTVKSHARSIFKKTGIASREELRKRAQAIRKAKAAQDGARPSEGACREQDPRNRNGGAPNNSAPPPRNA